MTMLHLTALGNKKIAKMRLFKPDEYFVSVLDIPLDELHKRGIEGIILDIDNTILPRTTMEVPDNLKEWVLQLKREGFKVCLLSNNWHQRVVDTAKDLDLKLIGKALKPSPHGFITAKKFLNQPKEKCVMIGDQTFTDILGAHLAGMRAILVMPLAEQDLWHTKLLRHLDKIFLRNMSPEGSAPAFIAKTQDKTLL